MQHPNK